jgi:hypothetical protein
MFSGGALPDSENAGRYTINQLACLSPPKRRVSLPSIIMPTAASCYGWMKNASGASVFVHSEIAVRLLWGFLVALVVVTAVEMFSARIR